MVLLVIPESGAIQAPLVLQVLRAPLGQVFQSDLQFHGSMSKVTHFDQIPLQNLRGQEFKGLLALPDQ